MGEWAGDAGKAESVEEVFSLEIFILISRFGSLQNELAWACQY